MINPTGFQRHYTMVQFNPFFIPSSDQASRHDIVGYEEGLPAPATQVCLFLPVFSNGKEG
jgi:hypothetical protein